MDFFSELQKKEKNLAPLEDKEKIRSLKVVEKDLYYQRQELFDKVQATFEKPIRKKAEVLKNEFLSFFTNNGMAEKKTKANNEFQVESKTIIITLEQTDSNSFSFRLYEKDKEHFGLLYTILIDETDETIYYCKYLGILNNDGDFYYSGKYKGDTVKELEELLSKLKYDIQEIESRKDIPEFTFKLCDDHYSYLDKEYHDSVSLFKEILSKYTF